MSETPPATLEEARSRIGELRDYARLSDTRLAAIINSATTILKWDVGTGEFTWGFHFPAHVEYMRQQDLGIKLSRVIEDVWGFTPVTIIPEWDPTGKWWNEQKSVSEEKPLIKIEPPAAPAPVLIKGEDKNFNYRQYLASREWALLKEQLRERSKGICEHCTVGPYQETHHMTYERIGHEDLADLLAVCRPCHAWFSAKSHKNPLADAWLISERVRPDSGGVFHLVYAIAGRFEGDGGMYAPCKDWKRLGKCIWCDAEPFTFADYCTLVARRIFGT